MKYPPREMKVEHLNWLMLVYNTNLHAHAKLIASYLNTYMNASNHSAWPSTARLAQETSLTKPTVIKYIGVLEAEGWLSKKPGGVFDGKNTPNIYTLQWPKKIRNLQRTAQEKVQENTQVQPQQCTEEGVKDVYHGVKDVYHGVKDVNGVVNGVNGGGIPALPKSVIESEIESEKRSTPSCDGVEAKPKTKRVDPLTAILPDAVDRQAWEDWVEYKQTNRKPVNTKQSITKTCNLLRKFSPEQQRAMVDASIVNGWAGLFERSAISTKAAPTAGNAELAEKMLKELSTGAQI